MERHVKERLIGAAVLIAAAVILIPEMLSGPKDEEQGAAVLAPAAVEGPLKTYTIDLSRSPATSGADDSQTPTIPDEAPPPELSVDRSETAPVESVDSEPPPATAGATESDNRIRADEAESSPAASVARVEPAPAVAAPAASPPARQATAPAPTATTRPDAPATAGWAVQLGSFASQTTANNMARDLRGDGFDAFVMPVKSGANTLYRVRIGPMKDRDSANRTLARVKPKVATATVVKHP